MSYKTIKFELKNKIANITFNQPKTYNSMTIKFWQELIDVFNEINDSGARVTIINGNGKHFTSGLDLKDFAQIGISRGDDIGRRAEYLRRLILDMQESFNTIEKARIPVIASIHGACIGGGIDLISACDIRFATIDSFYSIHEINIGMAADVGSLQRLPKLMPEGLVKEFAYTGRRFTGLEGKEFGLINDVFKDKVSLEEHVWKIANQIITKSPIALAGTKEILTFSRDHSVQDGLKYAATWNSAMLQSKDFTLAVKSQLEKKEAIFDDLETLPHFTKKY